MSQNQAENLVTLFKNHHGNVNVVLPSTRVIPFLLDPETNQGKFFTADPKIQRELQAAAKEGEFGVFVDPADPVIDLNAATPMEQLEKKIRTKLMAELQAGGKLIDAGISSVSAAQMQAAMSSTTSLPGASLSEEAQLLQAAQQLEQAPAPILVDGNGQRVTPVETVQPVDSASPALSALDKLKAGKTS